jgi:hypothetical protein
MNLFPEPEELWKWLEENWIHCEPQRDVTVRNISFDWDRLGGTCTVEFDGVPCEDTVRLSYDANGRIEYFFPMIHSPFFVPASYPAYILSDGAKEALGEALSSIFPRILASGGNRDNDVPIAPTPLQELLLDNEEFRRSRDRISNTDIHVTVEVRPDRSGV